LPKNSFCHFIVKNKSVLKVNVFLIAELIGTEGAKTPAGEACSGETPQER